MAKTYSKKDIFDGSLFNDAIKEAQQMSAVLEGLDEKIVKLSNSYKNTLQNANTTNKKGIEDIIKVSNQLNAVTEQASKIEKDKIENAERLKKAKMEQIKSYEQFTKEVQKRQAIEEKAQAKREAQYNKEIKQAQELNRPYNVLSKTLNELRKDYKDLAVAGEENTQQALELKKQITDLDAELKKVDATVGQHTRNVGNYEGAVKPLKTQLRELTMALQQMDESDPRFAKMVAEAGQLRDKISDTKAVIDATAGSGVENMAKGFAGLGKVGINAMQGIEGGMALFGVESERVMEVLVRLQALSALTDAIEGLGALGDTMEQIKASFTAAATQLGIFTTAKEVDTVVTEGQVVATETATVATSGLGKAMKALPIIAIIAGIAALVAMFVDWGHKATDIEKKQQALSDTMDAYNQAATSATKKTLEVGNAFKMAKAGVMDKKDALKIYNDTLGDTFGKAKSLNEAEKLYREKTGAYIKATGLRAQADMLLNKAAEERIKAIDTKIKAEKILKNADTSLFSLDSAMLQAAKDAILQSEEQAKIYEDLALKLQTESYELEKNTGLTLDNTEETKKNNTEKKKQIDNSKYYAQLTKNISEYLTRLKEKHVELAEVEKLTLDPSKVEEVLLMDERRALTIADIALIEAEIALSKAKQKGDTKAIEEAEKAVLKAKENQINAQLKLDLAGNNTPAEQEKIKKQAELDIVNLGNTNIENAEKEHQQRMKEIRQKAINDTIDEMKKLSDERIKNSDQIIAKEQELQDKLQAQANAGNIVAQESIAASIEAQKEATIAKQKEQRRQQRLEEMNILYNLIEAKIDKGDSAPKAVGKSLAEMALIKGAARLFDNIKGFYKGTKGKLKDEDTAIRGGKDGHLIWADGDEMIFNPQQTNKLESVGLGKTDDVVNSALMYKLNLGMVNLGAGKQSQAQSQTDLYLKKLVDVMESKGEFYLDPIVVNGIAKGVVSTEIKGNVTKYSEYRPKH